jgi:subtilisin
MTKRKKKFKKTKKKNTEKSKLITSIIYTVITITFVFFLVLIVFDPFKSKNYPWFFEEMSFKDVTNENQGEGITIAFLDTGVHHSLLYLYPDSFVKPWNFINNNTDVNDLNGHGTSMVSLLIANYDKSKVHGLAQKVKIMPVVIMDSSGRTNGSLIAEGIHYAVENGANIINLSIGSRLESLEVKEACQYAYNQGVIIVSAVGDYQESKVIYPARYNTTIAVQSQSKLGVIYKDASWGNEVDLLIPGEFIETLKIDKENDRLIPMLENGSSISTSIASGIIAILMSKYPEMTIANIYDYIRSYEKEDIFLNVKKFITL